MLTIRAMRRFVRALDAADWTMKNWEKVGNREAYIHQEEAAEIVASFRELPAMGEPVSPSLVASLGVLRQAEELRDAMGADGETMDRPIARIRQTIAQSLWHAANRAEPPSVVEMPAAYETEPAPAPVEESAA